MLSSALVEVVLQLEKSTGRGQGQAALMAKQARRGGRHQGQIDAG